MMELREEGLPDMSCIFSEHDTLKSGSNAELTNIQIVIEEVALFGVRSAWLSLWGLSCPKHGHRDVFDISAQDFVAGFWSLSQTSVALIFDPSRTIDWFAS